jgi:hypothetical protein
MIVFITVLTVPHAIFKEGGEYQLKLLMPTVNISRALERLLSLHYKKTLPLYYVKFFNL